MLNRMSRVIPSARRVGVLILLCGAASIASAQWAWRDENGRPVYSDQPPPAGVRSTDILQQPQPSSQNSSDSPDGGQPGRAAPPPAPAPAAAPAPKAPTMAEREQDFQKRMKEQAEAEKKLADSEAQAEQKASDCERARGYVKSLDDGVRLIHTNPDGSREMIDEEQRSAEAKRTRDFIEANCN
jgi:type IV secretory pathway VirB10-like protein